MTVIVVPGDIYRNIENYTMHLVDMRFYCMGCNTTVSKNPVAMKKSNEMGKDKLLHSSHAILR